MKAIVLSTVTVLLIVLANVATSEDRQSTFVKVQSPPGQDADRLLKQWQELPREFRKRVQSEIVAGDHLGLSSTGIVQLIGIYHQHDGKDDKAKPKRLFHLRQTDLIGARLFWSILVNAEEEKFKILFHINARGEKDASWLKLRDE